VGQIWRCRNIEITSLQTESNEEIFDHGVKVKMLWTAYKGRFGSSNDISLPDNPEELISMADDLEMLEVPFTHEEIDDVIKSLATDKSPGSDSFNNEFLNMLAHYICRFLCSL